MGLMDFPILRLTFISIKNKNDLLYIFIYNIHCVDKIYTFEVNIENQNLNFCTYLFN